jgi:NAD(P)-dependent dehydrogenase (short-subunit alcohol dehydrogenase family)
VNRLADRVCLVTGSTGIAAASARRLAVYFLSDESRAVTGQLLKVDGGWSIASVSPEAPR